MKFLFFLILILIFSFGCVDREVVDSNYDGLNDKINEYDFNKIDLSLISISENNRYFVYPNGELFFPVGTSLNGSFITYEATKEELETYFFNMKESGENFIRIDIEGFSWDDSYEETKRKIESGEITFLENPVGNFTDQHAKKVDYLIYLAEKYDIYLEIVLTSHSCTLHRYFDLYPYHKNNGGPVESLAEFKENKQARELFKQRIRYIIDTWGKSDRIIIWELENEINWDACGSGGPKVDEAWIEEMGSYLKNYEMQKYGFSRPVSFSMGSMIVPARHAPIDYFFTYTSPNTDIVQHHYYTVERLSLNPVTSAKFLNEVVIKNLENADFQKPFLENERKNLLRRNNISYEKVIENEEYAIWAYLASGAAGAGATWSEYITDTPTSVANSTIKINKFLERVNSKQIINSKPIKLNSNNKKVIPMVIANNEFALGWLVQDSEIDFEIELIREWDETFKKINPTMDDRFMYLSKWINILNYRGEEINLIEHYSKLENRVKDYVQRNSINIPSSLSGRSPLDTLRTIMRDPSIIPQEHRQTLVNELNASLDKIEEEIMKKSNNKAILDELYSNHKQTKTTIKINLDEGEYLINWFDSKTGEWIKQETIIGSNIEIETPLFSKHIAFIIDKK